MSRARHHKREDGGRTHEWVSGNPDVEKEAEHEGEGGSRKDGGFVKVKAHKRKLGGSVIGKAPKARLDRKRGGGVHHGMHGAGAHYGKAHVGGTFAPHGHSGKHHSAGPIEAHLGKHHGHVMTAAKHHRKRGGGVGSDNSPLSSAHKGVEGAGHGSSSPGDTYGGLPVD